MAKPGGKARGKTKPPPGPQTKTEEDDSSSNELSLKLRRGSSDSRDSFYMDFDQGIDSDFEQMSTATAATVSGGLVGATTAGLVVVVGAELEAAVVQTTTVTSKTTSPTRTLRLSSSAIKTSWSETVGDPLVLSSPTTPGVVLVSTDLSPTRGEGHHSPSSHPGGSGTQTRTHSRAHSGAPSGHGIPCSSEAGSSQMVLPRPTSNLGLRVVPGLLPPVPYQAGQSPGHTPGHPPYPHHHPECRISRSSQSLPLSQVATPQHRGARGGQGPFDALTTTLSALYGKLLVVMGIAFPMAEVISTYIPPSFYEGFYLYLYFGSMLFLLCMYATALRTKPGANKSIKITSPQKRLRSSSSSDSGGSQAPHSDTEGGGSGSRSSSSSSSSSPAQGTVPAVGKRSIGGGPRVSTPPLELPSAASARQAHYGSFYLRMGAVAFGIGSMIYSGLEFGQYFELERNTKCHNVLLALTPATRMAFIFIQMYFIFLNNEVRVYRSRLVARFGLMHMIGTNLSVWLNVLIQETKHEILMFYNPQNDTLALHAHPRQHHAGLLHGSSTHHGHHHSRVARGLKGPHHIYECRRTNIMGSLVQDASPFLFPCTIEYSLICAAILYVMWKNIGPPQATETSEPPHQQQHQVTLSHTGSVKRSPHHYSVDCARAHKGLFVGILALVLTIISLILFFVLISRPELVALAVTEVNVCELALYAASTLATLLGMLQIRELRYDGSRNLELDNILLIAAQTGMFIYSTFTIIGGHFTIEKNTALVLITALASLIQTTCQTIFILDASRRSCSTARQIRRKPGRQLVTFLLVANLAMWAVNTLEKSRAESHPIQLHFYGLWAWTIITHVSMPLAIFYRFHSTVCLCEIWKRAYKMKPTYM